MALPTNTLQTATLRLLRRRIADNIFKANPLAAWMLMRGRVKTARGGRFIAEPLMYVTNQTVQAYRGYDRLNIAPTEELTEAQYNWRLAAVSISLSGEEDLINDGPEQMFDMLKVKSKVAEMSLRQFLDEKMHAAVGSKDTTRDILGLDEIIDDVLNYSSVGGIDGNAEGFWRNQLGIVGNGTAAAFPAADSSSGEENDPVEITQGNVNHLTQVLNRMYHNCSKGITQPDLILTDQQVYERYETDSLDKLRITDPRLADLGFENIKFKNARIMWNENIKTQTTVADSYPIYFINSEFLSFTLHARRNFVMSQFVSPWDQDAQVAQILFAGNMTCSNRRHQGVCWVDLSP